MKIGVIGAGGWGTALACLLSQNNHEVMIWAFEPEVVTEINEQQSNTTFLPNVTIPNEIKATTNLHLIDDSDIYLFAVPTQFLRSVLNSHDFRFTDKTIVNVSKGIEQNTLLRISEILFDSVHLSSEQYVVISGPSHAEEVIRKTPTTVVAASEDYIHASYIQKEFSTENFRIYSSNDVVGCEIGGSLKNVMAIAAGLIDGLGLGDNTKAALITRGLAEMSRIGIALGANPITFSGLSGLGDLFVTCNSLHSRNRYVGEQIGKGKSLEQITSEMKMIAEGIGTTQSAYHLSRAHGVETPIIEQIYRILFENLHPLEAIKELMSRQSKKEWWW